jgi:hypothetical protein
MKPLLATTLALCAGWGAVFEFASASQYRAELLHPQDAVTSYASGASGSYQIGYSIWSPYGTRATLWNGTSESFINLHPPDYNYTHGEDVDGNWQVGVGVKNGSLIEHALLWQGTADSVIDLHPPGEDYSGNEDSFALGVSGGSQVGYVTTHSRYIEHAFLWHGSAESAIDLSPVNFRFSMATEVSGLSQVGWGSNEKDWNKRHALLWRGTAESVVDLHPAGFATSEASDVSGDQQVGLARGPYTDFWNHAILWNGSADDYIDLNPPSFISSEAVAIAGELQVGWGLVDMPVGFEAHAAVWKGTAESAVDLHPFLASLNVHFEASYATGIGDDGTIAGIAYNYDDRSMPRVYAILWTPVPEPATGLLIILGLGGALLASSRNRSTA